MHITHFRAKGFRCLHDTDWIPLHDLTVLIGENDGGKTATIDALEILLGNKQPDLEDFSFVPGSNDKREQEILLEARMLLDPQDMTTLANSSEWSGDDPILLLRAFGPESAGALRYRTMVHPDQRLRVDLNSYTVETLREIAREYNIGLAGRQRKADIIEAIEVWLASQGLIEGTREMPRATLKLLPEIQVFRSAEALDPEREVEVVLRAAYSAEIVSEEYSGPLADISERIENALNERVARLTPVVRKYLPGISAVRADPRFDFSRGLATSRLQLIGEDGRPISLEKKGEGVKRQVTLAVYEWNSELLAERSYDDAQPLLLAFDEPDSHLDYYCQRKIFRIIQSMVRPRVQVLLCTHSLNLINRVPITQINHYSLDDNRCTQVASLESDDEETLNYFVDDIGRNMGLENSMMFHERCFLVVEGPSEMNALPLLFRLWHPDNVGLIDAGIRLLNGENNAGARHFAKFLNDNGRNIVFMLDSDSRANPPNCLFTAESLERAGFDIECQAFFVGTREFEDAFGDELWTRVGNAAWPPRDKPEWSSDDFATLRSQKGKFSDQLCGLFRASKPEIAYQLAKTVSDRSDIPSEIQTCFEHALALACP
jgi:putative ATP-dependent endonuclease of OLD family